MKLEPDQDFASLFSPTRIWWWVTRPVNFAPCWRSTTPWRMALCATGTTCCTCGTTPSRRSCRRTQGTARWVGVFGMGWVRPCVRGRGEALVLNYLAPSSQDQKGRMVYGDSVVHQCTVPNSAASTLLLRDCFALGSFFFLLVASLQVFWLCRYYWQSHPWIRWRTEKKWLRCVTITLCAPDTYVHGGSLRNTSA